MATHMQHPGATPFPTSGGFERKLCRHGILIECRCVDCGFRFIGSVSHKLPTIERIHVSECKKKRVQRTAPKARKAHA